MAALGTIAASEALDKKEEQDDEYKAAQIQVNRRRIRVIDIRLLRYR